MQHAFPALRLALLLAAAFLAACGRRDEAPPPESALTGPPLWRLAEESFAGEATVFTLQVRTPGRARLRLESAAGISSTIPWRELAGGQTMTVVWSHRLERPDSITDSVSPADRDAGRTEGHAAILTFGFRDRPSSTVRHVARTRPGQGRVLTRDALPPGRYEALPARGPIELATVLFTDIAAGEAVLRSSGLASRVLLPEGMRPDDRVETLQLYLDLELVEEGG